jgi:hypothetical protein
LDDIHLTITDAQAREGMVPVSPKLKLWESEAGPHFKYLGKLERDQNVALAVSAAMRSPAIPLVIAKAVVIKVPIHNIAVCYT